LLRVLGFDSKRAKFGRHGRLFIGVSGLSRRGFSCKAIFILQSSLFPRWFGLFRWGRISVCYDHGTSSVGRVTAGRERRHARWTSWAGGWPAGPRAVEPPLAATRVARRHRTGLVRRFQPTAEKKNKKGCLFFQSFLNSKKN
jgi:hypothetical protein